MDTTSLMRSRDSFTAHAQRQEAEANRLAGLASQCQTQLAHKLDQLRRARQALVYCCAVSKCNSSFEDDMDDFARNLSACLDEMSLKNALCRLVANNSSYSSNAERSADSLVRSLEAECASLQSQLANLNSQANSARNRAAVSRTNAQQIQIQINANSQMN